MNLLSPMNFNPRTSFNAQKVVHDHNLSKKEQELAELKERRELLKKTLAGVEREIKALEK